MDDERIEELYKIGREERTASQMNPIRVTSRIVDCPDNQCLRMVLRLPVKTEIPNSNSRKLRINTSAREFIAAKLFDAGYSVEVGFPRNKSDIGDKYPYNWDILRKATYFRDDYTCQRCFDSNVELHAHHKEHIESGGEHVLSNLITLCRDCHEDHHGFEI